MNLTKKADHKILLLLLFVDIEITLNHATYQKRTSGISFTLILKNFKIIL